MRIDPLGFYQFDAMRRQVEFRRNRRDIGELVTGCMHIGLEARQREFFGNGHAADRAILLENQHRKPCSGEIAGASETVLSCSDDDGVVGLRHWLCSDWQRARASFRTYTARWFF
jgi:hypothetical protein